MHCGQVFTFDGTHQNFAGALGSQALATSECCYKQLGSYWISKPGSKRERISSSTDNRRQQRSLCLRDYSLPAHVDDIKNTESFSWPEH
jgi:hypothetical protein